MPVALNHTPESWIFCPECEAPCLDRHLPRHAALRCTRCGVIVKRSADIRHLQRSWAFASAGLFLVLLANVQPILTFDVAGNTQTNHIITGIIDLNNQGYWPVAILVFFAGIIGPALHLGSVWYVTSSCCLGRRWPGLHFAIRLAEKMEAWNLMPVYAVATVVSVVKLRMLGSVAWQQGAFWILALSLCSLFAVQFFDRTLIEERLDRIDP